jgi:hypothetical protein
MLLSWLDMYLLQSLRAREANRLDMESRAERDIGLLARPESELLR